MRSDASLDGEIKKLEQRIRDRRVALHTALDDMSGTVAVAKERVRRRAAPSAVAGVALVLGFVAARIIRNARNARAPQGRLRAGLREAREAWPLQWRREKPMSPGRQALAGVASIAVPLALKIAQRQAVPLIERAMHAMGRRRDYDRYRTRY